MKLKNGFVLSNIGDETYAVAADAESVDFNGMIKLTGIGEFLWRELQNEISLEKLVDKVLENYDVDRETAEKDTERFVEKLKKAKLFE